jgi:putative transposase
MVAAALRQAFQRDRIQARGRLRHPADQLRPKWPKPAAFIGHSTTDLLSDLDFGPFRKDPNHV